MGERELELMNEVQEQAGQIVQLEEKVRELTELVYDLETRCDPAGEVRQLKLVRDENEMLRAKVEELKRRWTLTVETELELEVDEAALARSFQIEYDRACGYP